ncbi:TIGR03088 family PEP-CTERM/XrtA system glycosyltransferase [Aliiglaciecola sp. 2_MG-2023]|uniref:TIGR03088 family PEP-CTERM/XrtA system glycosyltransferase n=1 Tax=unclassified Aliiglaciecola TaxID=2593648 RepID=UPI0026E2AC73|nr:MULTISPECIES: TIGR03088 family PEP-CTERM/XrtA system glycosyltransferase [unclassified Aliiglaciecola]MDO6709180.1 TIGR03088 family PEP-CTERM/XrtA system glycosyltransferase [Aliiglaciecola sp. 2_MG-2023]MDO6750328.1 TIGR03088 family PEP-CTERM/XrtA system glycosyltransferase [Aliiglaciecola sp. 1_MG-2023]
MDFKKTHIMHIIYRFDTGGLENGVVNLINRLDSKQYQHTIVTLKGNSEVFCQRIETQNVQFFDLAKKDGNDISIFFKLRKLLKKLNPDILHTRNTATIENQLVGWWCRVPYRIHGEHGWDVNDMHGQNKKYQMLRRFMKTYIHKYVALSTEAFDYLRDTIGVYTDDIRHICNGVDVDKFTPQNSDLSLFPEHFATENMLVFGTVGRLAEVKNQPFLLEAFIALVGQFPEHKERLRLVIVGDGVLMEKMLARTQQADLSSQVWFAGNRSDVAQLMNCMDVFVLPSLAEGISNTILEASASGLPVIATNVGGNPELIAADLKKSHLVEVNDINALVSAMSQYVSSPELKHKNGLIVRNHCVANFSIDTMVGKYNELYQAFSG